MMPTTTNYIPNSLSYPTQEIFDFIDQQLEKCQEKVQGISSVYSLGDRSLSDPGRLLPNCSFLSWNLQR